MANVVVGDGFNLCDSVVNFVQCRRRITISVKWDRFEMRTARTKDIEDLFKMWGDPTTMNGFAGGASDFDFVQRKLNIFCRRANMGQPFSAYMIYDVSGTKAKVAGLFAFSGGCSTGYSEVSYFMDLDYRGQKVLTRLREVFVRKLLPILAHYPVDGRDIEGIKATARLDNQASWTHLLGMGMKRCEETDIYPDGNIRHWYRTRLDAQSLRNKVALVATS